MQQLRVAKDAAPIRHACAGALLDVLPGLMRFVRCHMRSRRAAGLSVPQFRTLVQLHRRPATSLSVVAEALGATAPTTSRMVSGLVRKGYIVRRESSDDRRQVSLELTAKGQTAMQAAWSGTQLELAKQLGGLSASQLNEMTRALGALLGIFSTVCGQAAKESSTPADKQHPRRRGLKAHSSR